MISSQDRIGKIHVLATLCARLVRCHNGPPVECGDWVSAADLHDPAHAKLVHYRPIRIRCVLAINSNRAMCCRVRSLCGLMSWVRPYAGSMSFTALHRALGVGPGSLTEELLDAAVAAGVTETNDLVGSPN